ncbi:hypothetical protein JCM3766R1_005409 [Sporobolomyces carnicolor]
MSSRSSSSSSGSDDGSDFVPSKKDELDAQKRTVPLAARFRSLCRASPPHSPSQSPSPSPSLRSPSPSPAPPPPPPPPPPQRSNVRKSQPRSTSGALLYPPPPPPPPAPESEAVQASVPSQRHANDLPTSLAPNPARADNPEPAVPKVVPGGRASHVRSCDQCRVSKQKCDRSLPCSTCIMRKIKCSWAQAGSVPTEIEYIRSKLNSQQLEVNRAEIVRLRKQANILARLLRLTPFELEAYEKRAKLEVDEELSDRAQQKTSGPRGQTRTQNDVSGERDAPVKLPRRSEYEYLMHSDPSNQTPRDDPAPRHKQASSLRPITGSSKAKRRSRASSSDVLPPISSLVYALPPNPLRVNQSRAGTGPRAAQARPVVPFPHRQTPFDSSSSTRVRPSNGVTVEPTPHATSAAENAPRPVRSPIASTPAPPQSFRRPVSAPSRIRHSSSLTSASTSANEDRKQQRGDETRKAADRSDRTAAETTDKDVEMEE